MNFSVYIEWSAKMFGVVCLLAAKIRVIEFNVLSKYFVKYRKSPTGSRAAYD